MKRILVLLIIGIMLVLPVATAEDSGGATNTSENDLSFTQYPQVYVSPASGNSFNVSYVGLILITTQGAFFSYFPSQKWTIDRISNDSLVYKSKVHFEQMDNVHLIALEDKFNVTNVPRMSTDGMESAYQYTGNVIISLNKQYVGDPFNLSGHTNNYTGFQITFSFYSTQITGAGDLFLIQQLGAKIGNGFEQYHHMIGNFTRVNDTGIGVTSTNYDAYYWWNSTYVLNGQKANLSAVKSVDGNIDTVVFKYEFSSGIQSIVQDPYFSIPQVNLFNNPILQKDIQTAAYFLLLHAEYLAAGLATGLALLGFSYGTYRRRRF